MNLQEQIKRLMETRTQKALELEGVQKKALDEGRTKDETERETFKNLTEDIAQIDAELADLRQLEAAAIRRERLALAVLWPPAAPPLST
jgi:hypothetical protein